MKTTGHGKIDQMVVWSVETKFKTFHYSGIIKSNYLCLHNKIVEAVIKNKLKAKILSCIQQKYMRNFDKMSSYLLEKYCPNISYLYKIKFDKYLKITF